MLFYKFTNPIYSFSLAHGKLGALLYFLYPIEPKYLIAHVPYTIFLRIFPFTSPYSKPHTPAVSPSHTSVAYDVDHFIPWSFVMNDELFILNPSKNRYRVILNHLCPRWLKIYFFFELTPCSQCIR